MTNNPIAEAVIKRDRNIILVGLTAIVLVTAIYTVNMAHSYGEISVAMLQHHNYTGHGGDSFLNLFIM